MRPSMALVPLLLLLLIVTAQGIRLEPLSTLSSHRKIHEEKESRLVEESGGVGEVNLCKDGQCSGRSRKLMTNTRSTSKTSENEGMEIGATPGHHSSKEVNGNQENFSVKSTVSEHRLSTTKHYPDIIDIAGMDYSPARRKPPIHN
ncbi:uncharacterized protein LOC131256163 [Magnolia sinica]|uniref:uncharacterized protein LOC131256163 n=1 Tax=Magnolia sinica TaxID=86752 RepID=UPI00265AE24A|nr:uncharacterized protein LOC131256163 [Magnolia sinica]